MASIDSTVTPSYHPSILPLLEGTSEITLFDNTIVACLARPEVIARGANFHWSFDESCPISSMMLALCSVLEKHAIAALARKDTPELIAIQRMQFLLRGRELSDSVWTSTRWFLSDRFHECSEILSLHGTFGDWHTVSLALNAEIARHRLANLEPGLRAFLEEVAKECYGVCKDPERRAEAEARWTGRR